MNSTDKFINYLNEVWNEEGRKLISDFFITFSRFECALKASIKYAKNATKAEADWNKFLSTIKDDFKKTKSAELKEAVEFIMNAPPKIQHLDNGNLVWQPRPFTNEPDLVRLGQHIRDIRNNLFHGGKFNGIYEKDVSRNYKLLHCSIIILNEWLELDIDVKQNFASPIE